MSRHDDRDVLEALDNAWADETGFLGMLRNGQFSESAGEELLGLLESIEVPLGERLHSDFVRLVWFAPMFAEWQLDRVAARGGNRQAAQRISDRIRELIMRILGVP
jgi:hypothetical protein